MVDAATGTLVPRGDVEALVGALARAPRRRGAAHRPRAGGAPTCPGALRRTRGHRATPQHLPPSWRRPGDHLVVHDGGRRGLLRRHGRPGSRRPETRPRLRWLGGAAPAPGAPWRPAQRSRCSSWATTRRGPVNAGRVRGGRPRDREPRPRSRTAPIGGRSPIGCARAARCSRTFCGVPVTGFRSPRFDLPAGVGLERYRELLAEAGFDYVSDASSLGPASALHELPVLSWRGVPVGGGSYQRLLPTAAVTRAVARHQRAGGAVLPLLRLRRQRPGGRARCAPPQLAKQVLGRRRIATIFQDLTRRYGSETCRRCRTLSPQIRRLLRQASLALRRVLPQRAGVAASRAGPDVRPSAQDGWSIVDTLGSKRGARCGMWAAGPSSSRSRSSACR